MNPEPTVFIVDDDLSALDSVRWLVQTAGLRAETFSSPTEFLEALDGPKPGCLVLDIRMPEMNGLDLQAELSARRCSLPIIIVTGHGDVPQCSRAFHQGAFDFIEKSPDNRKLLECIKDAIQQDLQNRRLQPFRAEMVLRVQRLTVREREVMELLVAGETVKRITMQLQITQQSVARHRAQILLKLEVGNDVELSRLVVPLESERSGKYSTLPAKV